MDPNNNNSNSPNITPPSSNRSTPDSNPGTIGSGSNRSTPDSNAGTIGSGSNRSTPESNKKFQFNGSRLLNDIYNNFNDYGQPLLILAYLICFIIILVKHKNSLNSLSSLNVLISLMIIFSLLFGLFNIYVFIGFLYVTLMVINYVYMTGDNKNYLTISIIFAIISVLVGAYKYFLDSGKFPYSLDDLKAASASIQAKESLKNASKNIPIDVASASNKILWLLGILVVVIIIAILVFTYVPFKNGENKLYTIIGFAIIFLLTIGTLIEIYRTHPGPRTPGVYTSYLGTMFQGMNPLWWIPLLIIFFLIMAFVFIKNPVKNNASLYGIGGSVLAIIVFTIIGSQLFLDNTSAESIKAGYLSAFIILMCLISLIAIIMFSVYKFNDQESKYYSIITAVLILAVLVGFIIYLMRDDSSTSSNTGSTGVFGYIKKFLSGWNQWWIMLLAGITTLVLAFVTMFSYQNNKDSENVTRDKYIASIFLAIFTCITFYQALKLWSSKSSTPSTGLGIGLGAASTSGFDFGSIIKKMTIVLGIIMIIAGFYQYYIKPNLKDVGTISGAVIMLGIFFAIMLISLLGYFSLAVKSPSILGDNNKSFIPDLFTKMGYIIGIFILLTILFLFFNWLGSLALGSKTQYGSGAEEKSNGYNIFVKVLVSLIALGILYKVLMRFDWFKNFMNKPIFSLLLNIIFYIPCLLTDAYESLLAEYKLADKTIISLIIIELLIIIAYFYTPQLIKKQYMKDGKQLLNEPVKLSNATTVGELGDLYDVTPGTGETADQINFDYNYGLSFWTFIHSNPPNTSASFNKAGNILSFSDNPAVKYNPLTNTLFITTKSSDNDSTISISKKVVELEKTYKYEELDETIANVKNMPINIELDENNDRIIYKDSNFLLQKWNNIVINYHGGTLDIFINGKLVKSSIEVSPYMAFNKITLGQDDGISGGIANVAFFKKPLDIVTINTIYTSLKNQDPPLTK